MILDWIQSPWFTLTGWLFGLFGLVYAIRGFNKPLSKKLICAVIRCNHLVSKGQKLFPKMHLFFEDTEIEDVAVTSCAIWNGGVQTINRSDIASERILRIIPEDGCRILDAKIIAVNKPTNRFQINLASKDCAEIQFDYVDKNQGVIIEVIHEGNNVSFDCEIKGGQFEQRTFKSVLNDFGFFKFYIRILDLLIKFFVVGIIFNVILFIVINLISVMFEKMSLEAQVELVSRVNEIFLKVPYDQLEMLPGIITGIILIVTIVAALKMAYKGIPKSLRSYYNKLDKGA